MDAIAQALADPIRRSILLMLRAETATAGALAQAFPVSRPAVSRHLRVLREAGLVRDEVRGRERQYRIHLEPLKELESYLAEVRQGPKAQAAATWQRRFDALETEVQRVRRRRRSSLGRTPAKRKKSA